MDPMAPISGVSLEKYATLAVAMAETGEDTAAQVAIAAEHGVDEASWNAARDGWTARMQDPSNGGKVAHAFVPLYSAAQAAKRGGAEPATLEVYAEVVAAYSFEKGPDGSQLPVPDALARHGLTSAQWNEITGYWTPKVNTPADPSAQRFRMLMQAHSDRIFGIVREPQAQAKAQATSQTARNAADATGPEPQATGSRSGSADEGLVGAVMGWVKSLLG